MNALGPISSLLAFSYSSLLPKGDGPAGKELNASMDSDNTAQWEKANWSNGDPFNCTWQPDNIAFRDGIMVITLDNKGCKSGCRGKPYASGEYRTRNEYGYGTYEVRMKATAGDGLVAGTFFTYTGEWGKASHHEIDFEFLGKDPECKTLQLNYYAAGTGTHGEHEKIIKLPFNACDSFHNYKFVWKPDELVFYVDDQPLHTATKDIPSKPGKIMVNLWAGTSNVNGWLNPFKYTGPVQAEYDWITYTPSIEIPAPIPAPSPATVPSPAPAAPDGTTVDAESCACKKIAPSTDGIYQGAFVNDQITEAAVADFEKMAGQPLDIGLKFMAFATGLNFPQQEAEVLAQKGGAIFIKLEPWSWKGKGDQSFSLDKLIAGEYDTLLKTFAEGAVKFGKPIMVSFGHEMNGNWYPWAGNPELYQQAYRYVHDKISKEYGACNITWVWNPNIDFGRLNDYYPGDEYVDWVAVDGYNTEDWGSSWRNCSQLFSGIVDDIAAFNKPIMIGEFASDANNTPEEKTKKPAWITECMDYYAQDKRIKAYIYFNQDKVEDGQKKAWAITTSEAAKAYSEAIKKYAASFIETIQTTCAGAHPAVAAPAEVAPAKVAPSAPGALPKGFSGQTVNEFFTKMNLTISPLQNSREDIIDSVKMCREIIDDGYTCDKKPYLETALFENLIADWLNSINIGATDGSELNDAFDPGLIDPDYVSLFWKAVLGIIALNDQELSATLFPKLFPRQDWVNSYDPESDSKKLYALDKIYTDFIQLKNLQKLKVEYLTEKAFLLLNIGEAEAAQKVVEEALQFIDSMAKEEPESVKNKIATRNDYGRPSRDVVDLIYENEQAKIKLFNAKLLMLQAEVTLKTKFESQEEYNKARNKAKELLDAAYKLAGAATQWKTVNLGNAGLQGLERLEAFLIGGQCLVRQAGIKKDQGDTSYQADLNDAKALLEYVVKWGKDYDQKIPDKAKKHPWMKILSDQARLWLGKIVSQDYSDIKERLAE